MGGGRRGEQREHGGKGEGLRGRLGEGGEARGTQEGPKAIKLIGEVRDEEPRGCGVLRRGREGHRRDEGGRERWRGPVTRAPDTVR